MSGQLQPPASAVATAAAPLLGPAQAGALLDQVVYEQIVECIDLDQLYHLAQSLDTMIGELEGVPDDQIGDLAGSILDRSLHRLPDDLRGYLRASEWAPREDCVLCQAGTRRARRSRRSRR